MKRALVLSGGGSKGSHQVGILSALADHPSFNGGFDFIAGTSVGAINAVGLAHYEPRDFKKATEWLEKLWLKEIKGTRSIWRWKFPWFVSALYSDSIGQTKPLKRLLEKVVDPQIVRDSGIHIQVPAVNVRTAEVKLFTEKDDLIDIQMASSAFPSFFPPYKIDGELYTDGGVRDIAPLKNAIDWGADEIFVIITRNPNAMILPKNKNFFTSIMQTISIMTYEIMINDIQTCLKINQKILKGEITDKKYINIKVFYPTERLGDSLSFKHKLIYNQIELGKRDLFLQFK